MTPRCSVWVVRAPDRPRHDQLAMLTPEERAVCERFRQAERRARFACGRALLRHALAATLGVAPGAFEIAPGRHRRPELAGASARRFPEIDFNLSSTPGLVACAVAAGARVGVDIEGPGGAGPGVSDFDALGELVFAPEERRWLARQPDRERRFYQLWTLKEAVAKADGEGLGLPFERFWVLPDAGGTLAANLSAVGGGRGHWRIVSLEADVPAALALLGDETRSAVLDVAATLPDPATFDLVPVRLLAETG